MFFSVNQFVRVCIRGISFAWSNMFWVFCRYVGLRGLFVVARVVMRPKENHVHATRRGGMLEVTWPWVGQGDSQVFPSVFVGLGPVLYSLLSVSYCCSLKGGFGCLNAKRKP